MVARRIILFLILSLCLPHPLWAAQKVNAQDKIISSSFKTLAKAFVAASDIAALKKNNIAKLNQMSNEKFRQRYEKVYAVIKDLPSQVKADYGISDTMTKEQAIKNIEGLDKKAAYALINAIPDEIIAGEFRKYLSKKDDKIQKDSLLEQIKKIWHQITRKF